MKASSKGIVSQAQRLKPPVKQRPFLISRVLFAASAETKRQQGDAENNGGLKLCKKCEGMALGMGSDTIHSTLAYSRCRCHRLFKYRKQRQATETSDCKESQQVDSSELNLKASSSGKRSSKVAGTEKMDPSRCRELPKVEHKPSRLYSLNLNVPPSSNPKSKQWDTATAAGPKQRLSEVKGNALENSSFHALPSLPGSMSMLPERESQTPDGRQQEKQHQQQQQQQQKQQKQHQQQQKQKQQQQQQQQQQEQPSILSMLSTQVGTISASNRYSTKVCAIN